MVAVVPKGPAERVYGSGELADDSWAPAGRGGRRRRRSKGRAVSAQGCEETAYGDGGGGAARAGDSSDGVVLGAGAGAQKTAGDLKVEAERESLLVGGTGGRAGGGIASVFFWLLFLFSLPSLFSVNSSPWRFSELSRRATSVLSLGVSCGSLLAFFVCCLDFGCCLLKLSLQLGKEFGLVGSGWGRREARRGDDGGGSPLLNAEAARLGFSPTARSDKGRQKGRKEEE